MERGIRRACGVARVAALGLLLACASVSNTKTVRKGPTYPPYEGPVQVFWKEHGTPPPGSYVLIATVSGRATWCGVTKAKFHEELHQYLIAEAGRLGGTGVILHCGEVGTVGECYCYGDAIRLR